MKNKLFLLITTLFILTNQAYSFTISNELKAASVVFGKMILGVVISVIIIYFGLIFYGRMKDKVNIKIKLPFGNGRSTTIKQENFKCEIDDAKTMEEAINTFLKINN